MREFVADVGNSRMKIAEVTGTGLFNPIAYSRDWQLPDNSHTSVQEPSNWTIAGTDPAGCDSFARVLGHRGHHFRLVDDYRLLPLQVGVEYPPQVGIDRLLNAVAALAKAPSGMPIVIVSAGTAVTVDLVDAQKVFRGGAIFPGFRLMAQSLNDHTAKLPRIDHFSTDLRLPGANTNSAIAAGITNAVIGGIERIVERYAKDFGKPHVVVAGGDAELLVNLAFEKEMAGPFLTLEGIRIAADHIKKATHGQDATHG